jgi:phospholipid/cholesterol/gamma-HCH transport system permease protein
VDDSLAQPAPVMRTSLGRAYLNWIGKIILGIVRTLHGLGAFALITLGVTFTKFGKASDLVHPLIYREIARAGVKLLPMVSFVAFALGLVVIGQTVSLLNRVGAQEYAGTAMVTVIVRELGPLVTALLVLARVGTVLVIELSTNRATGEVEALEALGIDPIHYLVMPRVLGLAASIFSLTVYMIIVALVSGFLFAFIQDVPLSPGQYLNQLAASLRWQDFALLALKTISFGAVIAVVTCFHGLARPVRLQDVGQVTSNAVVTSVVACVLLDALFIIVYLVI